MEKDELNKELTVEANKLQKEINSIQRKINTSNSIEKIDILLEERAEIAKQIYNVLKYLNETRYKQYGT